MPNKQIGNIDTLQRQLAKEDAVWQQRVFNETGVVVLPSPKGQSYWKLISACGSGYLDDIEYHCRNGGDDSSCCDIQSVEQMITYIKEMDSYRYVLQDVDLGGFKKSDLFWTIYYRIFFPNRYSDDSLVYGMKQIVGPGCAPLQNMGNEELWFRASAVGIDELGVITISLSEQPSLNDIVDSFAEELRSVWSDLDMGEQEFEYDRNGKVVVPKTYDEVVKTLDLMSY